MRTVGGGGNDKLNLGPMRFKALQRPLCAACLSGTPVNGAVDLIALSERKGRPHFSASRRHVPVLDDKRRTATISPSLQETQGEQPKCEDPDGQSNNYIKKGRCAGVFLTMRGTCLAYTWAYRMDSFA